MERSRRHHINLLDRHIIKRRDFILTPEKPGNKFSNVANNILGYNRHFSVDYQQPSTAPAREIRNREALPRSVEKAYARLIEDRLKAVKLPAIPVAKTKR